jgi:tetratricopeptide (TPR) repeat protein
MLIRGHLQWEEGEMERGNDQALAGGEGHVAKREEGRRYATLGEHKLAIESFKAALDAGRQSADKAFESEICAEIGDVFAELGEVGAAMDWFERAEQLDRRDEDQLGVAAARRRLGAAFRERGNPTQADDAFDRAERILDELEETDELCFERSLLFCERGVLAHENAHYRRAIELFEKALVTQEGLDRTAEKVTTLRLRASSWHQLQETRRAIEDLEHARKLIEAAPDRDAIELIEINNLLGGIYEDEGKIGKALDLYRASRLEAERLHNPRMRMECLRRLGSAEKALGDHNDAIGHYTEALKLARDRADEPAISELLGDLSDVRLEIGEVDQAIQDLKRALKYDLKHEDVLGEALVHRRLGMALQHKGRLEDADEAYQEAMNLLEASDDSGEKAVILVHWGSLYEDQGRYSKALSSYREARQLNEVGTENHIGSAICWRHEASVLRELGDFDDARGATDAAEWLLRDKEDHPELVEVVVVRALILLDERKLQEALEHFDQALRSARKLDLPLLLARIRRGTGEAQALQGSLELAEMNYREALDEFRKRGQRPWLSDQCSELGNVCIKLGRFSEAIKWLEQALELESEQRNELGKAVAQRRLGYAFQRHGDFKDAQKAYEKSHSGLEDAEDGIERATLDLRWGSLLEQQGEWAAALRKYETALSIFQGLPDKHTAGLAACLRHRASVLWQQQDLDASIRDLVAARELLVSSEERPEAVAVNALLGSVYMDSGLSQEGRKLLGDAAEEAKCLHMPVLLAECLRRLASALATDGRYDQATSELRKALEGCREDEVLLAELYDDLGDIYLASNLPKEAVKHYTEGRRRAVRLDRHVLIADILLGLARAYRMLGQTDSVRLYMAEAEDAIARIEAGEMTKARLKIEQAKLVEDDGRGKAAIQLYEEALGALEGTKDARGVRECRELLLRAHAQQDELAVAGRHLVEILGQCDPGALWAGLVTRLSPAISEAAADPYEQREYSTAVLLAFRVCEATLREITPRPTDAVEKVRDPHIAELASTWFTRQAEAGAIKPDKASQLTRFWEAAFSLTRNVHAHGIEANITPTEAFAWLAVTHLLHESLTSMQLLSASPSTDATPG